MKYHLLVSLLGVSMMSPAAAQADRELAGAPAARLSALPDPELTWRSPQWLSKQRERSRWRYQLGLEQQPRAELALGPRTAVREAVWAGVSYDISTRLSGGVETPVWQRDSGGGPRIAFEKPKGEGLAGLRGAFSYQLSPQSRLTLRPQARRVMLSYSATW